MYTIETFKQNDSKWNLYTVIYPTFSLLVDLFGNYLTFNTLNQYNNPNNILESVNIGILVDLENYVNVHVWIENKYINEEIRFKNIGSELIYKIEQLELSGLVKAENSNSNSNSSNKTKKLYMRSGRIDLDFFNTYIKAQLFPNDLAIISKSINHLMQLEPEERYFEYYSITTKGRKEYLYLELLLLDINHDSNKFFPIFISDINTSSPYALERCYTDYDYDNSDSDSDSESDIESRYVHVEKLEQMMIKNSFYNIIKQSIIDN